MVNDGIDDGIEIFLTTGWPQMSIDYCNVEIKSQGTGWKDLQLGCDCTDPDVFRLMKCIVPHVELIRDYNFENCDSVQVRV